MALEISPLERIDLTVSVSDAWSSMPGLKSDGEEPA